MLGDRVLPCDALAPWVHHFWVVQWDLRTPFMVETLPHPGARLTVETRGGGPRTEIAGVRTGRLSRRLTGSGRTFGVAFRPAAFQPLLGAPMSNLTDRGVRIRAVFGSEGEALARRIHTARGFAETIALAETFLARRIRSLNPEAAWVRDLVERLMLDRSLLRVEDVVKTFGVGERSLQRLFQKYVGVSPKWVIRRYRLHEAAEQLRRPTPPALAELATALGYADQAHFAREFKEVVGRTPRDFQALWRSARRVRGSPPGPRAHAEPGRGTPAV
jgi:AraC-like DNA-binding protein